MNAAVEEKGESLRGQKSKGVREDELTESNWRWMWRVEIK